MLRRAADAEVGDGVARAVVDVGAVADQRGHGQAAPVAAAQGTALHLARLHPPRHRIHRRIKQRDPKVAADDHLPICANLQIANLVAQPGDADYLLAIAAQAHNGRLAPAG